MLLHPCLPAEDGEGGLGGPHQGGGCRREGGDDAGGGGSHRL